MKKSNNQRQQKQNHKQRKNNETVKQKQKEKRESFASRMKAREYERASRSNREYHENTREIFRRERQRQIGLTETIIVSMMGGLGPMMADIRANRNFNVIDESHRLNDSNTIDLDPKNYTVKE